MIKADINSGPNPDVTPSHREGFQKSNEHVVPSPWGGVSSALPTHTCICPSISRPPWPACRARARPKSVIFTATTAAGGNTGRQVAANDDTLHPPFQRGKRTQSQNGKEKIRFDGLVLAGPRLA